MSILVTGGAGYIGTHAIVEFLSCGHDCIVLDNLSNSSVAALENVSTICGQKITSYFGDVRDYDLVSDIFSKNNIEAVVHFAGLKSVAESMQNPLKYYDNNVYGSQVLLKAMENAGVFDIVFSSSATVYGIPEEIPISELCPLSRPTNPYGKSKFMVEEILQDLSCSDPRWRIAILRYFNPVGAHVSGLIGEDPMGVPNNLLPYITQVAVGKLPYLSIFGGDYHTHDGTGVRDYIHVVDLARGHIAALQYLQDHAGVHTWNLGTGQGYSVLDMVKAFEVVSGVSVPYKIVDRRVGDIAMCYSNPAKALAELGWQAQLGLERMMADSWRWQKNNPDGYEG